MTDNTQLTERIDQALHDVEKTLVSVRTVNQETLTDIQGRLFSVYEQASRAGDTRAAEAIEQSWIQVQNLHNAAISSHDAAQTIADLARELKGQRNEALKEVEKLTDDLENVNLDNPLIRSVHSEGVDSAFEDFDGFHTECPGCDCFNNGHLPEIDHDGVNILISALMGHWGELSPKRTRQLTRFVNTFGRLLYDEDRYDDEDGDGDDN